MKTCMVTGNRPKGFPFNYYDEENKSRKIYISTMVYDVTSLIDEGCKHFICGGAIGVDLDFANIVLNLRDYENKKIELEIAIPCENQEKRYSDFHKTQYYNIIQKADFITVVSDNYSFDCMQKRNIYMVDKSDIILSYWNFIEKGGTFNTLTYAKKLNKTIFINDLNSF